MWSAAAGYDLAATSYERWYWRAFWSANEAPLVDAALPPARPGATALDAGTGTGQYLSLLSSRGYTAAGLDLSEGMLARARERLGPSALLVRADLRACPFAASSFDVVVASRVLSHLDRLDAPLGELGRITRSGGLLILTDVSAQHRYVTTRIPTGHGDVHIETYKHAIGDIERSAVRTGAWTIRAVREIRFRDLVAPPAPADYPSIDDSSDHAIFFCAALARKP